MYRDSIRAILSPAERRLFSKLHTPRRIQDYLDTLPINFELDGETYMSPRRVLKERTAHCFEGALLAATALAYHGQKPLLLDLRTTSDDEDHVVTVFRINGRYGAISKTNHSILRYRDPVYKTIRELAISYFHEYMLMSGKKTLREYSAAFDLSRFRPERWVTAEEELGWLVEALDNAKHFPVAPKENLRSLRKAARIELQALTNEEWAPRE